MNHTLKRTLDLRRQIWFHRTMLQIFRACIETRTLPTKDSPCHKLLKRILKP